MSTANVSNIVLVDASGWIEYFGEGLKADAFSPYLEREADLIVPTIVLYEVCKKLTKERGKATADRFTSQALRSTVVPLDHLLALEAVRISLYHRLSMLHSVIYATAQAHEAQLVTADTHYRGLPGVIIP